MCVEEQLVQVHFMTSQGSLWYWTAEPEESWEDIQYFVSNSKQVNITLEESISTQRKQLYSYLKLKEDISLLHLALCINYDF